MDIHSGYIYVIIDESQRRKLGFSKDADIRVDTLQIGNAELLQVEYRIQVCNMIRAENALHSLFAADHIRGEWFRIKDISLLRKIFKEEIVNENEERLLTMMGLR